MLPINLALTSHTGDVGMDELSDVAAALQKQIARDFTPIWQVTASISAFSSAQIPPGYWPISVENDLDRFPGAAGIHLNQEDNSPYALVLNGPSWSLSASHEMLEMLADPWGSRTVAGLSLAPEQNRVEFLVEICDPCEAAQNGYTINGVLVSDFYTPHYFDPVVASGVRYSFSGALTAPWQLLPNGYLSWIDARRLLFQAFADGGGSVSIVERGPIADRGQRTLREYVDGLTPLRHQSLSHATRDRNADRARRVARQSTAALRVRMAREAQRWRGVSDGCR